MDKIKIGIIGTGGRGRLHIRILAGFQDVELVAVCDPVAESRDAVAEEFGIPGRYDDLTALLDDVDLDAAVVAPPAHLNGTLALPVIERGIHTLMEKPPGLTVEETIELKETADRTGAKVVVGWNRRFHPVLTQAREAILDRGPVTQVVGEFHKSIVEQAGTGRFSEAMLDQLLLETPIHAIDTIRFLAGADIRETHAVSRRAMSPYRDVHAALVEFENGVVAQITANYTTAARLERYEIHGHGISVYAEGVSEGTIVTEDGQTEIEKGPTSGTEEQNRYFIDCVKHDRPPDLPAADLAEALKTMHLAHAILAATT